MIPTINRNFALIIQQPNKTKMEKVYIDLGNGGFTFAVEDSKWGNDVIPVLTINGTLSGHQLNETKILFTPERLKTLGEFLIKQGENAEKTYCNEHEDLDSWGGRANSKFKVFSDEDSVSI